MGAAYVVWKDVGGAAFVAWAGALEAIRLNAIIPARLSELGAMEDAGVQRSHAAEKVKELRQEWGMRQQNRPRNTLALSNRNFWNRSALSGCARNKARFF